MQDPYEREAEALEQELENIQDQLTMADDPAERDQLEKEALGIRQEMGALRREDSERNSWEDQGRDRGWM